jgi:hypothetical protein
VQGDKGGDEASRTRTLDLVRAQAQDWGKRTIGGILHMHACACEEEESTLIILPVQSPGGEEPYQGNAHHLLI